jgi:hypothetical protein
MSATGKGSTAYVILMLGAVFFGVGIAISFTGIGACLGIPMVFLALPMIIYGGMRYSKEKKALLDASVSRAVSQSVTDALRSTPQTAGTCSACGRAIEPLVSFCPHCGAKAGSAPSA